jgi:outer membrane protein OmpA-like peptidoglycan-associated protein
MRIIPFAAASLLVAGALAARAEPPSADDIIASLKPNQSALTGPTRGIRPAIVTPIGGETYVTRATARAETAPATADTGERAINLTVEFKSGSAILTPGAERTLSALGHALTSPDLSGSHFRVEGHTDTVGDPDTNRTLSQQRADAVVSFLESRFGIDAAKLKPVGVGSDSLIVPTPAQTPEPKNRAVKIVNLGA